MEKMTVKEQLEKVQSLLGLTQKELGIYIGVGTRTINSWMTGDRTCPTYVAEMALRLAEVDAKALEEDLPTTTMFRWAVISETANGGTLDVFGTKAEAMRSAEEDWRRMHQHDKRERIQHEVGLIHVQLVEPSRYDGRFSWAADDGDIYEIAKSWI